MFDDEEINSERILDLLEERSKIYAQITERVLNSFGDCLTEVIKKYSSEDTDVILRDIQTIDSLNGFVKVEATGWPAVGITIAVDGGQVKIDESNKNLFKRVIRLVLPVKLLITRDVENLVKFATDLSYIIPIASDPDIEKLLKMYYNGPSKTLSDVPSYYLILEKQTRPKTVEDFSTATLSEKQLDALNMFKSCITETRN